MPMTTNANYSILCPKKGSLDAVLNCKTWQPFSAEAMAFLNALSMALLKHPTAKQFPEIVALGFWLRKGNLQKLVEKELAKAPDSASITQALGVVFHIAPSNVDTIFIYSWALSFIMGNKNIVRLPQTLTPQVSLILTVFEMLLAEKDYKDVADRLLFVQYERNQDTNTFFSGLCNLRVIWGGDNTINTIRQSPLPPLARDLCFADRYSFCIINAKEMVQAKDIDSLAEKFYNDVTWFDQMGCSSPRSIYWVGNTADIEAAKAVFWEAVERQLNKKNYHVPPKALMEKLNLAYETAIDTKDVSLAQFTKSKLSRVAFNGVTGHKDHDHCGAGLVYEFVAEHLERVLENVEAKDQTVTVVGFARTDVVDALIKVQPRGIARIVPFGEALSFSPYWDSYNLFEEFGKRMVVSI